MRSYPRMGYHIFCILAFHLPLYPKSCTKTMNVVIINLSPALLALFRLADSGRRLGIMTSFQPEGRGFPTAFGILGFAVRLRDLFSQGETTLATVEQANRWLCQPAVTPISGWRLGGTFVLLSDVLCTVNVGIRHGPALLADVQPTFDALTVVFVTTPNTSSTYPARICEPRRCPPSRLCI